LSADNYQNLEILGMKGAQMALRPHHDRRNWLLRE